VIENAWLLKGFFGITIASSHVDFFNSFILKALKISKLAERVKRRRWT